MYFPKLRVWEYIVAALCAGYAVYCGLNGVRLFDNLWVDALGAVLVITGIGIFTRFFIVMARTRSRISRLKGVVCTRCLYDLTQSPVEGKCPECGEKYTHDDLLGYWGVREG